MKRPALAAALAAGALLPAACRDNAPQAEIERHDAQATAQAAHRPPATERAVKQDAPSPLPPPDPALLESRDCAEVIGFYRDALAAGDFAGAARVWRQDAGIGGPTLRSRFGGPATLTFAPGDIRQEGAAGSLYCEIPVRIEAPGRPVEAGTLTLRRANDVPGATAEQLRWHIESSTFGEGRAR